MKNHKWSKRECIKCGVSGKGRLTQCPPSWYEKEFMERIWYPISHKTDFSGLMSLKIE